MSLSLLNHSAPGISFCDLARQNGRGEDGREKVIEGDKIGELERVVAAEYLSWFWSWCAGLRIAAWRRSQVWYFEDGLSFSFYRVHGLCIGSSFGRRKNAWS